MKLAHVVAAVNGGIAFALSQISMSSTVKDILYIVLVVSATLFPGLGSSSPSNVSSFDKPPDPK